MNVTPPFTIIYAAVVKQHIRAIEAKHHSFIRREIEQQLRFGPDIQTRNRKPLTRTFAFNPEATWELRFGPDNRFRIFYAIAQELRGVYVLAIGIKRRNRLVIGGEEVAL